MKSLLKRCVDCGMYTLRDVCPKCGGVTRVPHPPKYSPEDKYQKYRILQKLALNKLPTREEVREQILRDFT